MTNLENLTEEEKKLVADILKEISDEGSSSKMNELLYADYDEIPVDISTFLHEKQYLGNALYDPEGRFTLFEYWEETLKDIFPDNLTTKYNTLIFTGAIGLGKSTIAVICLLYLLYRLLCLKDPYLFYGLQPIDKITVSFLNITIENARGVGGDKLNQMIMSSSWFMSHGEMRGLTNLEYIPNKHIELVFGSSNNQIIGRALFCNFTDEVNFSAMTNNVESMKQKQKQLISQIDARMKSRFLRGDYLPTLNIIASSKNSDQSFLDEYIRTKQRTESKTTLIVDEPQWVVDPRKVTDKWFYVGVGNKFLASELLPIDATQDLIDEYRAKGYNILKVPIAYYENFNENIDGALTDIAGIATASSLKYISGIKWNEIKTNTYENPFIQDVIEVGTGDDIQYSEFFDLSKVPSNLKAKPLFIHLDMSQGSGGKGDKTGIAGVYILGKQPKIVGETSSNELFYKLAFSVSIKAPKGQEISFDKNRAFIRWLRNQGFKIKGVSADTFQSAQIRQQLTADHFETAALSVDRLDSNSKQCLPYAYLKSTIYDKRLIVYSKCDLLTEEVVGLERQSDGHIQHPDGGRTGCFTGDTKISLVDGRELSFIDLVKEFNNGKQNFVYSFNTVTKKIEPKLIENAWCTRHNAELVEVELDNGEKLRCTPDHRFMMRDGTFKEARNLIQDDSLMPLYRKYPTSVVSMKNYRMYYEPIEDAWHYEHRQFATEILDEKYLVHHRNCNCHDNSPTNLVWCSISKHQAIHNALSIGSHSPQANSKRTASLKAWYKSHPQEASEKARKSRLTQLGFSEESYKEYQSRKQVEAAEKRARNIAKQENAAKKRQEHSDYIHKIESTYNIKWDALSLTEKNSYSVKYQRLCNPATQAKITSSVKARHKTGGYDNAHKALQKSNNESKLLKELIPTIDPVKFKEIFGFEYESLPSAKKAPYTVKYRRIVGKTILNHKVVSVRYLNEVADVYDITVADNHNFALSAGVFVHNSKDMIDAVCGAVYNASFFADEFSYNYGESLNITTEVNSMLEGPNVDFEQVLMQRGQVVKDKENDSYLDFGNGKSQEYWTTINDGILLW